ncbi:unnamed protein product [Trichogramma brassicae]|uniref:Uncharacterized protein n=1 Tax=Trichogramma brassicae TaxID=86971 RepID=A0A6H5I628_9HYME|nr:unnamed protein product [Trichogramma brassicae]
MAELLLRRGADPNLADAKGSTLLHTICKRTSNINWAKMIFELSDEKYRPVQVDTRDGSGLTPLQYAVAHLLSDEVDVLLVHGADVSSFVFPSQNYFADGFKLSPWEHNNSPNLKLRLVSDTLIIVERLEKTGYKNEQSQRFDDYQIFCQPRAVQKINGFRRQLAQRRRVQEQSRNNRSKTESLAVRSDPVATRRGDQTGHVFGLLRARAIETIFQATQRVCEGLRFAPVRADVWKILPALYPFIRDYEGQLPNLREIFQPEAIDWLLSESVKTANYGNESEPLIDFVIRTGYRDEPKVNKDGNLLLLRTTPVHLAKRSYKSNLIRKLFKIYDRFDVNYIDDDGLSHFHVACELSCNDAIEKFFEQGQDLNLADDHGSTPLHFLCKGYDDNHEFTETFLKINEEINQMVQVDVRDNLGHNTPLLLAMKFGNTKIAELLLRRGANLNMSDFWGCTPLLTSCKVGDDFVKWLFAISDEIHQPLQINVRDFFGLTPLQLVVSRKSGEIAKLLLRRGADPNLTDEKGSTLLHTICSIKSYDHTYWMKMIFELSNEKYQPVQVNTRDDLGWTPLQWAVANLLPDAVNILLDHDLSLLYDDEFIECARERKIRDATILISAVEKTTFSMEMLVIGYCRAESAHTHTHTHNTSTVHVYDDEVENLNCARGDLVRRAPNSAAAIYFATEKIIWPDFSGDKRAARAKARRKKKYCSSRRPV